MQFFTSALLAVAAFSSAVYGRAYPAPVAAAATSTAGSPAAVPTTGITPISGGANAITSPLGDKSIEAGKPYTIKWNANYGDKVTLTLRKGDDTYNLDTLADIASNIPNSGSFTWTPSKDLKGAGDYTIQITSGDSANYSPRFSIDSSGAGVSASKTATASSTKSSTSASTSAPSSSSTKSASPTKSGLESSASKSSASSVNTSATQAITAAPEAIDSTGAAGQVHSPLALVLCIVAGLIYLH